MTENRYNLVDEAWIPVADAGLVSLRAVFQNKDLRTLSGTPLQKIAVLKLLLAVAQAAHTPHNDAAWADLGPQGMSQAVLSYLDQWHDRFWLYGEKPFLQMPAVKKAVLQSYAALMPEVASGNNPLLTQWQHCPALNDADKALLLLVNMSCCFGGKKTDKKVILTKGHSKGSAKSGPALCRDGLLHTFLSGTSLQESVWLNLQSAEVLAKNKTLTEGVGLPPWQCMPEGEACPTAHKLTKSLMGRLVPLARFCLLEAEGLRYVEGIQHPDYQQGYADPSASVRETGKKPQILLCDPSKRPWRSLTALLSFLHGQRVNNAFSCPLVRHGVPRLMHSASKVQRFGLWSGGVKVSSNAGEQYLTGADDMVESEILLDVNTVNNEIWFVNLQAKMLDLEAIAKTLYGCVFNYFKTMKDGSAEGHARTATHMYWQLAEQHFQDLIAACADTESDGTALHSVMGRMVGAAHTAFHMTCPQNTARQLQAWACHSPRLGKFLAEQQPGGSPDGKQHTA